MMNNLVCVPPQADDIYVFEEKHISKFIHLIDGTKLKQHSVFATLNLSCTWNDTNPTFLPFYDYR
jgi:hypothetical protein